MGLFLCIDYSSLIPQHYCAVVDQWWHWVTVGKMGALNPVKNTLNNAVHWFTKDKISGVRATLGTLNHNRRLIHNYAKITNELLEKTESEMPDRTIKWEPKHTAASSRENHTNFAFKTHSQSS